MDPNEVLVALRAAVKTVAFQTEEHTGLIDLDDALAVVELFQGLDTWLSNGGVAPESWKR